MVLNLVLKFIKNQASVLAVVATSLAIRHPERDSKWRWNISANLRTGGSASVRK